MSHLRPSTGTFNTPSPQPTELMWRLDGSASNIEEVQHIAILRAMANGSLPFIPGSMGPIIPDIFFPRPQLDLRGPCFEYTSQCTTADSRVPHISGFGRDCPAAPVRLPELNDRSPQPPPVEQVAVAKEENRKPNCARCRNHGVIKPVKGHKRHCPYKECECDQCILIKQRQVIMKRQVALRRQQEQDAQNGISVIPEYRPPQAALPTPPPSGAASPVPFNRLAAKRSPGDIKNEQLSLPPIKRHRKPGPPSPNPSVKVEDAEDDDTEVDVDHTD